MSDDPRKALLAGSNDKGDDLWKLLEEGYLEEVVALKDIGLKMHEMVRQGVVPTKREVAIAIMAALSFGEVMKRRFQRMVFDKTLASVENKSLVHITLKKPEKGGYTRIGKRIAAAIKMTEVNLDRLKKYGILSGSVCPADIPKPSDFPEIDSVNVDQA